MALASQPTKIALKLDTKHGPTNAGKYRNQSSLVRNIANSGKTQQKPAKRIQIQVHLSISELLSLRLEECHGSTQAMQDLPQSSGPKRPARHAKLVMLEHRGEKHRKVSLVALPAFSVLAGPLSFFTSFSAARYEDLGAETRGVSPSTQS